MAILDGKLVAATLLDGVRRDVAALTSLGVTPKLVVIQVGDDAASKVYVGQKLKRCGEVGIASEHAVFPDTVTTEELVQKIYSLNEDTAVHGILVQLPLPKQVDTPLVIKAISPAKDVDGFTAYNVGKMFIDQSFEHLAPCTPRGVIHILMYYKIPILGAEAVVVGASNIVGKPLAAMLLNRRATVTVCHSKTRDLASHTKRADILCVAVGKPGLITADMVKDGAVVVDVGMNRLPDGTLCGDVDFEAVSAKASFITPVPGGVGPMTVACLMENVVIAAKRLAQR